jgi:hypothetical protein
MLMTANRIKAVAGAEGLTLSGCLFDTKLPIGNYQCALGLPSRTIDAGPRSPAGYRNNQVHIFDSDGVYLTEHHHSRLIESVNFVFDPSESLFPIDRAFCGDLNVDGQLIRINMLEDDLDLRLLARDLPGEYSIKHEKCWIGISAKGRRDFGGKRRKPRYVIEVSVCF